MSTEEPWGDCVDTIKYSKPLDEWYKEYPKLPYNVFRLPDHYSFNLEEMQSNIEKLLKTTNTISITKNQLGNKFSRYRGLGFFSRVDSDSPLEDHFTRRDYNLGQVYPDNLHLSSHLPDLYEDDFTKPTVILDQYFQKVFSVFKSKVSKASLLDLRANGWLGSHVDFPYYKTIRLHASIKGSENAWYEIDGQQFQIPQDGCWYFIDTGKYHSVWNNGPAHRLTLNVNLVVDGDPRGLASTDLL